MRHITLTLLCLLPWSLTAQTPETSGPGGVSPAAARAAVSAVIAHHSVNPLVTLPGTGKPLATDGHWSVATHRPQQCGDTTDDCVQVQYTTAEPAIVSAWIVDLTANGTPRFLAANREAALYFLRKLSGDEITR